MAPWLMVLEAYMVQALLRTPAFHRGVEKVVKTVHRVRHGMSPEELGGTKIDRSGSSGDSGFAEHFLREVKTQLGRAEREEARSVMAKDLAEGTVNSRTAAKKLEDESADAAWADMQKTLSRPEGKGFLGEYMGALRSQIRDGKAPR
jgi:hypothetical protein